VREEGAEENEGGKGEGKIGDRQGRGKEVVPSSYRMWLRHGCYCYATTVKGLKCASLLMELLSDGTPTQVSCHMGSHPHSVTMPPDTPHLNPSQAGQHDQS